MRLIDADALKEEVNKKKVVGRFNTLLLINNAPTVESEDNAIQYTKGYQDGFLEGKKLAERPQGEWIVTAEDSEGIHRIQCPFCRYERGSDFIDYIIVTFEKFPPFCEKCGADMRGKKNEIDN